MNDGHVLLDRRVIREGGGQPAVGLRAQREDEDARRVAVEALVNAQVVYAQLRLHQPDDVGRNHVGPRRLGAEANGLVDGDKVRVFASRAGDILIDDVNVVQSSDNVSGLFRVLAAARITGVSYVDLASLFIDGAKLNGAGTGVTRSVLEAAISEMARWNKDTSVPLRIPLAAGRATEEDFRFVKLKDLPRLNSVFTGVGFEDIQLAVQSGVRKTMSGEPQHPSPMEELIKL